MTDIREKVARAICESEMGLEMLDAMPNTAPRYYSAADAALLACGYAEMRKALADATDLLDACHMDDRTDRAIGHLLLRTAGNRHTCRRREHNAASVLLPWPTLPK